MLYAPPEIYLDGPHGVLSNQKTDIWSVGIILIELILNKFVWSTLQLGQKIRKVLSLIHCNTSIFEKIAREHNCFSEYQVINLKLLIFIVFQKLIFRMYLMI